MAVKEHIKAGKKLGEICKAEQKEAVCLYVIPNEDLEKVLVYIKFR